MASELGLMMESLVTFAGRFLTSRANALYRDEEAHSIGKFFSVFYISSEDMSPQYAADKFIDGYKHSVNL